MRTVPSTTTALARPAPAPALDELARRFVDAQLAGDRRAAVRLLVEDGLGAGYPVCDLHVGVVARAQEEIGLRWERNEIGVAQEHLATAISQLAMSHLYPHLVREAPIDRRVLVCGVEGERHELGARMVADFLEMAGFDVRYLGGDVPTDSLTGAVRRFDPHLVAFSVTMSFHAGALERAVAAVRTATAWRVPIIAGGRAFELAPGLADRLGIRHIPRLHDVAAEARAIVVEQP